jgi:DinB family protein
MDQTTRQTLSQFPRHLEAHFNLIPPAYYNWRPASWEGVPSEPFPALGQICHVRDIEVDGYHVRFRRIRTEIHPTLEPVDGDALAVARQYAHADPAAVLAAIRDARAKTLALLDAVGPGEWQRTAVFGEYGTVTLLGLVHYLCSHDQQHLAGLQWLLGRIVVDQARVGSLA